MRAAAAVVALAIVGLGACSDDGPVAIVTTTTSTTTTTRPAPTEIVCDVIQEQFREFEAGVDQLVFVDSPVALDRVRDGTTDLDLAAFRDAVFELRALESSETPIGSVAEMLAYYDEAAALAQAALDSADPYADDGPGARLAAIVADDATFISNQGPVLFAVSDAGCR